PLPLPQGARAARARRRRPRPRRPRPAAGRSRRPLRRPRRPGAEALGLVGRGRAGAGGGRPAAGGDRPAAGVGGLARGAGPLPPHVAASSGRTLARPPPSPLPACLRRRFGLPAEGYLLVEKVPEAVHLRAFVEGLAGRPARERNGRLGAVADELGRLLRALHG